MPVESTWRHRAAVALHVVLAVGGSWGVVALAVPLAAVALTTAGMARAEATALAMMLSFVAYLLLLLWAFSVTLPRLLLGLLGSAALMAPLYLVR